MTFSALEPTPTWDEEANESTVEAFEKLAADEDATISIWCRDNCPDCRRELPELAAALDAADFSDDRLRQFPVDDEKEGELVEEYEVEFIPTIVVERDGEELARFVEQEALPAPHYLAEEF